MGTALALAFALAMDATTVSVARGFTRTRPSDVLTLPLLFGFFQAAMAALGWITGEWGGDYFAAWDHWIAFGLLLLIGGKMIAESLRGEDEDEPRREGVGMYLALAIATSIDAAAAGITLPLLDVNPWLAVLLIGVVTAGCCLPGYLLGRAVGNRFGARLGLVGGLVLIAIGTKILAEHLGWIG